MKLRQLAGTENSRTAAAAGFSVDQDPVASQCLFAEDITFLDSRAPSGAGQHGLVFHQLADERTRCVSPSGQYRRLSPRPSAQVQPALGYRRTIRHGQRALAWSSLSSARAHVHLYTANRGKGH